MPTTSLDTGDIAELITIGRWDIVSIRPEGGKIRVGKHRRSVQRAQVVEDGDRTQQIGFQSGENIFAYGEADGITVHYETQGFLSLFQPRQQQDVDITASSATLDTDITAASATLDTNITGSSVNVPIDIQAAGATIDNNITGQTVTVEQDQTRRSSEGVTEVNADQTATISTGGSQTTTVTADANEVWALKRFYYDFNYSSSGSDAEMKVTVETEKEGIELSVGQAFLSDGEDLFYNAGGWGANTAGGTSFRDALVDTDVKIDDTNGLNVVIEQTSGTGSFDNTRTIRFQFEVISV